MLKVKMKSVMRGLFAVVFLALAGTSFAQYVGPGEMKPDTTVAQIASKPIEGQQVLLRGNITKKYGKKHYEFTDDTGKMRMKADDKLFYNQKVTENSTVEIFGEVEKDFLQSPQINVLRITVLKP